MKKSTAVICILLICLLIAVVFSACQPRRPGDTFYISYDTQGGTPIASHFQKSTDTFVLPPPPTKEGFVFDGWYTDAAGKFKYNPNTFKINADVTLYAHWIDVNLYPHSISVLSGNLIVRVYDSATGLSEEQLLQYADADVELSTLTAAKSERIKVKVRIWKQGYRLVAGSVMANDISVEDEQFIMPAQDVSITFAIEYELYNIMEIQAENGHITPETNSAIFGQTVNILVLPNNGYRIDTLKYNNIDIVGTSFAMPSTNVIITASFTKISGIEYPIDIQTTAGGSVLAESTAKRGEYVSLSSQPLGGYYLQSLSVNGVALDKDYFLMPEGGALVQAVFAPIDYTSDYPVLIDYNVANGSVYLSNPQKTRYSAGEKVDISATALDGYTLGYYLVDSLPIYGDSFIMPPGNVVISAVFEPIARSISASVIGGGSISFAKSLAYPADLVEFTVVPSEGYVLASGSLTLNGDPLDDYMFIMPDAAAVVAAEFVPIDTGSGANLHTITLSVVGEGIIELSKYAADPGDVVFVEEITASANYRLKTGTFLADGQPLDNYFIMPAKNIVVSAEFERVYTINSFYDATGYVFADKAQAVAGETVNISFGAYGSNTASGAIIVYDTGGDTVVVSDSFVMPAGDVWLSGDFPIISTQAYSVSCLVSDHGKITADLNSASEGRAVTIKVVPDSGYKLDYLYYTVGDQNIPLAATFIMPAQNVGVRAVFVPDTEVVDPKEFFDNNKLIYAQNGGKLEYHSSFASVSQYLSEFGLASFTDSISSVLACNFNTDFVLLGLNKLSDAPYITQKLAKGLSTKFGGDFVSALHGNWLVITSCDNPTEELSLIRRGITPHGELLLYTRTDGSFSVLSVASSFSGTWLDIPNQAGGKAITRISPKAFISATGLQQLSLGVVAELADDAFFGLTNLQTIELSRIKTIGNDVFKDCFALQTFYIASYNSAYATDGRVLYERYNDKAYGRLIRYAPQQTAEEYSVNPWCQTIAGYAFLGSPLVTLKLASVNFLEDYALFGMDSLASLNTSFLRTAGVNAIYWQGGADLTIKLEASTAITSAGSGSVYRGDGEGGKLTIVLNTIALLNAYRSNPDWHAYDAAFYFASNPTGPFTVYFYSNGGSYVQSVSINNGNNVSEPMAPQRDGYTFAGWYTDDNTFQNAYNFLLGLTADLRLYAKWEPLNP